ncbi:tudor domain-containing protein 6 isoform X2 [Dermochelys coriacea]|uniref:tudor domain-containing protein 6 isoform X2 n=1 Tax=Dermochelys coriacea TaxID=27794 RepID=UPI0018E793E7|nr:tudor domain-containing protein 6 isoform X2 [Dermochelys coriacea]
MCSVQGIPSPGTTIGLRVSFVDVHPEVPLVRLWGLPGERREEYARLHQDIQAKAGPRLVGAPGAVWPAAGAGLCPGDLCLVELGDHWHRCRVVSRQGPHCRVFLLDEGRTVTAGAYYLARGGDEFFHLPSEVLGCVLADLVPPGAGAAVAGGGEQPAASWTAGALEFLGYLQAKQVSGLVREVLMPQRLVLLELPWLLAQMHHLGLAKQITPSCFRALLKRCLAAPRLHGQPKPELPGPAAATQYPVATAPQPGPGTLDFFYPRLQLGVTEPVLVTQISDPHRVYCQLQSLSQEIQRLSDSLHQTYETAARWEQDPLPEPGSPCAARGIDGRWYRALLLEIFPGEQGRSVAQVICVDYGRKEFVTGANLRRLPVECFRMPVVTYPCALQGISDGGCGWSRSQLSGLKALLLGKAVSARIEAYSPFEHLYYVNLYGEKGLNLNCLYGVQTRCLAHSLLQGGQGAHEPPKEEDAAPPKEPGPLPPDRLLATAAQRDPAAAHLPGVRLKVGVFYDAQVSFVRDPSEFWLRLKEHLLPFSQLMRSMSDFYSPAQKLDGIVLEPQPRSLCCAKWKENAYYRAVITRVLRNGVEVHLVDRGNREILDWYKVKELLPQFRELPAVALKCCLADVSPLGETWSKESVAHFKRTVQSKELVIQVLGTQGDKHVIEVLDHSQTGEKNISKILSQGGYAKFQGAEIPETLQKLSTQSLGPDPKERAAEGELVSSTARKSGMRSKTIRDSIALNPSVPLTVKDQPTAETCHLSSDSAPDEKKIKGNLNLPSSLTQYYLEIKPGSPYEGQLEVGSTVQVVISYVESPGYFWCQLSRNNQELKTLMAEIQDYCKTSTQPHHWASPVCLAKYSEDEKWYRALIISGERSTEQVEVIYVDYGNKEMVSVKNLCSINANFLKLKAQAFRCSLYNLIQPNGQDPFIWDEKAILAFQEFVDETADHLELKCTIFALAAINNKELFNVVDLITPFQSVCHFLTEKGLARPVPPQKSLASSVQLHSYYYSTHDIKIGSEEEIYVTHVDNPWKFYCQLARSANVLEQLTNNIGRLSKVLHSLKMSQNPGNLYLARYTDNHWYRGVVLKTKPNKEVFFVDFGNIQVVKKEDLISIPSDAYDILLLPMQAIKCSLSDISNVPKEATTWFETAVLDKPLKMVVVAKESDGKLIVELYDGNIQINAKMKEGLSLPRNRESNKYVENETLRSKNINAKEEGNENMKLSATYMRESENRTWRSEIQGEECNTKTNFVCKDVKHFEPVAKRELSTRFLGSVERFNSNKVFLPASTPLVGKKVGENKSLPFIKKEIKSDIVKPDTVKTRNQGENSILFALKSICDLPPRNLMPGLKTLVYISHVNNPSDFYIQLASDEPQLNNISEGLNNKTGTEGLSQQQLQVGDLICAVFSEDGLWYRAVVKQKLSDERISVQYIDYGNTSVVNVCETNRLPEKYSSIPMMSIHSSLAGVQSKQVTDWTQEAVSYFSERTSEVQINCEFVEKLKDGWEIVLYDEQGMIAVDLINETFAMKEESQSTEALNKRESGTDTTNQCEPLPFDEKNKASSIMDTKSFFWKTPEVAQTVETYVTVVKGPEYFWCQMADPENINHLEKKLQEIGELEISSVDDFRSSIRSGDICIAKYSEDGKLYRAKVSSIKDNNLTVRHVDYGSEELVGREMIRQIPDLLLTIPMQAFPCCLSGFNSPEGSWSNDAKDKFYDMTAEYLLEVTVIEIQKDSSSEIPLSVVKLECNGKNINEEMKCFWKHNTDTTVANIQNAFSEKNEGPGTDYTNAVCLEKAAGSTGDAEQENTALQDALLCAEPFHLTDNGCLNTAEIEEKVSLKTADEHQTNFEILNKVGNPLLEKESNSKTKVYAEPKTTEPQLLANSEAKDLVLEPFEAQFFEDDELKAEMLELSLEVQSFLGEERKELLELPSAEVQPSLGENVKLLEMEQLQTHSSLDELKKLLLELESLEGLESFEGHPFLGGKTKEEVLELESLEMQTSLTDETKEKWSEVESLQIQLLGDETGELMKLKSLEVSPSFSNRENWLEMESSLEIQPVCGGGERGKLFELIPSEVQISLGEETKESVDWDLDLLEVHQMKAVPIEFEVESSLVKTLLSNGARKELEPETHKVQSQLGAERKEVLELVPSEVQASLGDETRKDTLELESSILETSADKFSFPKTDFKKQVSTCPVELCDVGQADSRGEKCKKWLTLQEKSCAEPMKPDLHEVFREYKNTLMSGESLRHKPSDEEEIELREKQDATLAGRGAEQSEHACNLEGFAVGSKCMVWTCLKWCEARILEISDEGTRVLNLSNGNEEIVNPENVWNGIPEVTKSPYEGEFHVTDNLHSLSVEGSMLKEKRACCGTDVMVDPYMLSSSPENATE